MTTHRMAQDLSPRAPSRRLVLAVALVAVPAALACAGPRAGATAAVPAPAPALVPALAARERTPATPPASRPRYTPDRFAGKAARYYRQVWGVEALSVRLVESGELVRFAWRVVDPARAGVLNDRKLEPALLDARAGVSLVVPAMEKVGPLRQGLPPEAGRSYWMAFSNKGRLVKRGDRVSVVVGTFRADGLVVDE
jgi:hypothetical protein